MAGLFQISGLVSGLQTGAIIDQLMALERRPLDQLAARQQTVQQRLAAYQALAATFQRLAAAAAQLARPAALAGKQASVDVPGILTATADAAATPGTFRVTVEQVATATRIQSAAPIGLAVAASAPLAQAGFFTPPTPGTFTLRGVTASGTAAATLTIDAGTVLSDGVDDASSNSILGKINSAAGLGITASLVNDASGRPNLLRLVSAPGVEIQLGSGADTSNFLSAARLLDAVVQGNTAATVTGAPVAAGALPPMTITINGVTTTTTATASTNTAAENAASIAADITNTPGSTVTAVGNADGTITLTQLTAGARYTIAITAADAGTGFTVGTTRNGTDQLTSAGPLGVASLSQPMASARLATPLAGLDANGNGSFTINGATITYNGQESLQTVLGRINSAGAGATATYDPLSDRVLLTATRTGAQTIALQDGQGNLLAALGLAGAPQSLGQNALYWIDTVNGGQQLASPSNTITGIVPGVTLHLLSASASPVAVTVSPDLDAAVQAVQSFVAQYNQAIGALRQQTRIDPTGQTTGVLAFDSSLALLEQRLRQQLTSRGLGLAGPYQSLADVGLSFGAVGTAPGAATSLALDEAKLRAALEENPPAVAALFSGFASTATLSGSGSIASISGAPTAEHRAGSYQVDVSADGTVRVTFTPAGGVPGPAVTGTIAPGGTNVSLIPGVTLTAAPVLADSTQTITVQVQTRGVMVDVQDALAALVGAGGLFASREEAADQELAGLQRRLTDLGARLDEQRQRLEQQFASLEAMLARLQQQSNALQAQLAGLGSASALLDTLR